jgi:hypothetical protein
MRKRTLLVAMAILAFGLIGTTLSAMYQQPNELILKTLWTVKVSYGFPLSWYGYSEQIVSLDGKTIYWYSVESLLIDAAFWLAISFFLCVATLKLVNISQRTRASKNLPAINV